MPAAEIERRVAAALADMLADRGAITGALRERGVPLRHISGAIDAARTFGIGGLDCSLCTGTIEKALGRMAGVDKVAVSRTHEQARISRSLRKRQLGAYIALITNRACAACAALQPGVKADHLSSAGQPQGT